MDRLTWEPGLMRLGDLSFRLVQEEDGPEASDGFEFYRLQPMVRSYQRFWEARPDFDPKRVLELGIWDGGSAAFWFEVLQPQKYVGVDRGTLGEGSFDRYLDSTGLRDRLSVHWGVDQADRPALGRIADREFDAPIDLVLDDASHRYGPTKASFEVLYPRLRPGGLYVIEDWGWRHWQGLDEDPDPRPSRTAPTRLVVELIEAAATAPEAFAEVTVNSLLAVVQRGPAKLEPATFRLEGQIFRRPDASPLGRLRARRSRSK
jgi:predicted O-methyltransferase YrrM